MKIRLQFHNAFIRVIDFLLLIQPFLSLLVFLSVLTNKPPLWLSWIIALLPIPIRYFRVHNIGCRTPFDIPIIILTAGMLLGYFLSPSPQLAVAALNTYLACILFYYGVVSNKNANRIYWITFASFFFIVFLLMSFFIFAGGDGKFAGYNMWLYTIAAKARFLSGLTLHSNVLGIIFGIVIPILLAICLFPQQRWLRYSAGIIAVIFGAILILTAAGGGWIAASLAIIPVLAVRGKKTILKASIALVVIVAATIPLWYRTDLLGVALPYENLIGRTYWWKATILALSDHPFTGLGLCGWWSSVNTVITPGGPHSTYLQLYSDCGIIGLVTLIVFIYVGIKLATKIIRADKTNQYFGLSLGFLAGCTSAVACAFIENIFVNCIILEGQFLCFNVPLIWLLLAGLVVSCRKLADCQRDFYVIK